MSANAKPSFGFGELAEIKPDGGGVAGVTREIDAVADRLGFGSREAAIRRRRRPPVEEPTDQINIRAAIIDINRFVEWCERKRYSYREGFAELVGKIEG
jgi:hypothetical protein